MAVSRATRAFVFARDGHVCQGTLIGGGACGGVLTIHHLVPREDGGSNHRSNLLSVCRRHHDRIHLRHYREAALAFDLLREVEVHKSRQLAVKLTEEQCVKFGLPWGVPGAKRRRNKLISSGRVKLPEEFYVRPKNARPEPPPASPPPPWPLVPAVLPPTGLRPCACQRCGTVTLAKHRPPVCPECWWPHDAELWTDADGVEYALTPRGARALRPVHSDDPAIPERLLT